MRASVLDHRAAQPNSWQDSTHLRDEKSEVQESMNPAGVCGYLKPLPPATIFPSVLRFWGKYAHHDLRIWSSSSQGQLGFYPSPTLNPLESK